MKNLENVPDIAGVPYNMDKDPTFDLGHTSEIVQLDGYKRSGTSRLEER